MRLHAKSACTGLKFGIYITANGTLSPFTALPSQNLHAQHAAPQHTHHPALALLPRKDCWRSLSAPPLLCWWRCALCHQSSQVCFVWCWGGSRNYIVAAGLRQCVWHGVVSMSAAMTGFICSSHQKPFPDLFFSVSFFFLELSFTLLFL